MANIERETDERIFEAAREVFHEKGYDGARMQEIADRAGMNKALLHYYYRSKDLLFETVFQSSAEKLLPQVVEILSSELPFPAKIETFVSGYIDTLLENPYMPGFILHELNRNPERLRKVLPKLVDHKLHPFIGEVEREIGRGGLAEQDPRQFVVNMLALCIFPFLARPVIQELLGVDPDEFVQFLNRRKMEIPKILLAKTAQTMDRSRMEVSND